jgi:serine protease Do
VRATAVLGLIFAVSIGAMLGALATGGGVVRGTLPTLRSGAGTPSFADIFERVNPAVVNISVIENGADVHEGVDGAPAIGAPRRSEGTGFVVDGEGYILTNQHLVNGTSRIRVRFADRTERAARLVGADASTDIALVKVEGGRLPVVPLGDSDSLRVGDWVCAIGNPYSFDHTVTAGVVSSKGRKIFNASFDAYIQTDAAINPGNSGGPLLNAAGEAIGISTAVSTEGQGIGFAVPINLARSVIEQLRSRGRVSRGYLGIQLEELDPDLQKMLDLPKLQGAMILDVLEGHAGEAAGLRRYDVIQSIDKEAVQDGDHLVGAIAAKKPGSSVELAIFRDGRTLTLHAVLADRASDEETPTSAEPPPARPAVNGDVLGLVVVDASRRERREMGLSPGRSGVVVSDVVGLAPGLDTLAHGDVVLELNRHPTPDLAAYRAALASLKPGAVAWLYVYRTRPETTFLAKVEVEAP